MKSQIDGASVLQYPWLPGKDISFWWHKFSTFISKFSSNPLDLAFLVIAISLALVSFQTNKTTASDPAERPNSLSVSNFDFLKNNASQPVEANTPACAHGTPNITDGRFSVCPSVTQDYKTLPDGVLKNSIFTAYAGAPEANQEAQYYSDSPENISIKNGALTITATNKAQAGFKYTSGRIDTKDRQSFLYGKLTIRAVLPDGVGTWPAIWLLPANDTYKNMSPPEDLESYKNGGEIDIAESVGASPNVVFGIAHSLAHPVTGPQDYYSYIKVPDNHIRYHDYGIEWTPTQLTFTLDGRPYFTMYKQPGADYHSWPYDQPFYLIVNLALGGTWGGIDRAHFPPDGVDSSALPAKLQVQSISYYPLKQK